MAPPVAHSPVVGRKVRSAMLLSAGLGTRMRPLTDHTPKPLIEIAGRTLIDRVLDKLVAQGVERAVVNVHHLAGQMEAHLARRADIEIIISDERDLLLETGGGVVKALPHLGSEPFFAINTDVAWETEGDDTFLRLARAFDPGRMDAVLLLADMTRTLGFHGAGDFFLDDEGRPVRRGDRARAPYVYAGAYVCTAGALAGETVHPFSANRYWDRFAAAGRLFATVMSPFWLHVGDPEARDKAERWLLDRAAGP